MCNTSAAFHPLRLQAEASLNRTCIAPLAGADPRLVGRPAFDLLSLTALNQLTPASGALATSYGIRLAHLIATLVAPGSLGGCSPWRAAYLRHWRTVEEVWLGGGTARRLGPALAEAVGAELVRLGARPVPVGIAEEADILPLIGLARARPGPDGHRVVLDFGHTAVKRGIATIDGGRLVRVDVLASAPAPSAEQVIETVVQCVADSVRIARSLHEDVLPGVRLSLATYIVGGRPSDPRSIYAMLGALSRRSLQQALRRCTQAPVHLSYVHDGTAGARAVSSRRRTALIMLGTALGVGFAPTPSSLVPVAHSLIVKRYP